MGDLKEPLLQSDLEEEERETTNYAKAGLFSRICFCWLNPLLHKAARKTLEKDDVPLLAPQDRSAEVYERFIANWSTQQRESHSLRTTLLKTFWKPLLHTAVIAACRISVLFVGPLLIESFVGVASGNESFAHERYVLILVLFFAKTIEAVSSHQYNFACARLGMQIKSALMTSIYRKGLRLSSLARQSHGMGPITNHMSVDVQSIADAIIQVNNLWVIPVQVLLGGVVMYPVVGLASLAGLLVMAITAWLSYKNAKFLQRFMRDWAIARDSRMKATVEVLANIKIIKLHAWDARFLKAIEQARNPEFSALTKFTYTIASGIFLIWLSPLATSVAIFGCYVVLMDRGLTPSMAFTTISTVRVLQELLRLFPNMLIYGSQALISLERIEKFLWSHELPEGAVVRLPRGEEEENNAISVEAGTFTWDVESDNLTLQDINVQIKRGSFVAVVGRVGAGKSSLLAALQGEIPKVAGTVTTRGSTACAGQSAWIQNATIQTIILFGQPMDKERYKLVCDACALQPDFAQFESGDKTEIGEQGINLSGGQKQRVQLARALYQDSDIYFLDDIFSAVDAETGSHLFRECVLGALDGKTVVLVTHHVEFLIPADLILVLRDGKIVQSGKYNDILIEGSDFKALVGAHTEAVEKMAERGKTKIVEAAEKVLLSRLSSVEIVQHDENVDHDGSVASLVDSESSEEDDLNGEKDAGRLIKDEQRGTGRVSFSVYWMYLTVAYGGLLIIPVLIIQTAWQIALIACDYWVAFEASFTVGDKSQAERFIYIYAALAFSCAIFMLLRTVLVGFFGLVTAQNLYLKMLRSIFRAPMSFFDTTPNGRILSRSTTDQFSVDYVVPTTAGALLTVFFQVAGILVVACQVAWQTVILVPPLAFIYSKYQTFYFSTSRELTRVDGITKAPIISHFSETVAGFATIRCFQQQNRFIKVNQDLIDCNLRMDFHNIAAAEWVALRMEFMAVVVLCASAIFVMFPSSGSINPNLVGLALSYVLSLNQTLFNTVSLACTLENKMVSVERVGQYTKLPTEAPLIVVDTRPPPNWPSKGSIILQNLKVRFRLGSPLVLKGISANMEGGKRFAIVGRTGSGKSTIIMALFRLMEPCGGRILIDGVDIGTIGLTDLRSKLGIIPQDPVLFNGSVRSNVDPLGEHTDSELWDALEECQLASNVRQLEKKLDAPILANGENWSVGQRQLFGVCRVVLKHTRILLLDEATSAVDAETEIVIQKILQKYFVGSTIFGISHRIHRVLDCDLILVLHGGKLVEYDSPFTLLDKPNSVFSKLAREYYSQV